jgi:DNA-binding LacI/PurR family transcriptional regulator
MARTGIHDLARHLGLTVGTVSRALNNRPEVNEKTRERVMEAALAIGYAPNQSGRSLRTGTTNTVGFMLESGTASAIGGGDFFMQAIGGMQQVLSRHGFDLVLLPCGPTEDPHDFLRRIVLRGFVDGLIISATQRHDRRIELLARSKVPFVALGRSAVPIEHAWIDLDFEGVAHDAVARLAEHGHRRIAVALPASEINLGYVFRDAYRAAMVEHGLPLDAGLEIAVDIAEEGGAILADRLVAIQPRPTAIVLINELLAIGLYHRLSQLGMAPGHDLAVVGFRDNPQVRFLSPRLSCYHVALTELGVSLGETLLSLMPAAAGPPSHRPAPQLWPLHYTEGESDANPPL